MKTTIPSHGRARTFSKLKELETFCVMDLASLYRPSLSLIHFAYKLTRGSYKSSDPITYLVREQRSKENEKEKPQICLLSKEVNKQDEEIGKISNFLGWKLFIPILCA